MGPNYNESKLPPHLSKFLDKKGNPNKEAQARIDAGRKKRADAAKIKDVTPPGYGPKEDVEMAIMSLDHKEAPRKLKITPKGLDALRAARDKPKVKTQVKITKKGRDAIKDEVEMDEGPPTPKFKPLKHKVWSADASIPAGARPKDPGKIPKYKVKKSGMASGPPTNEDVELDEAGRPRGAAHIENTRFWDLKDKELHYIIKDAGQAVQANPTSKKATQGPGNWSDQINDAATVLYYRKKNKIRVEEVEDAYDYKAKKGAIAAPGSGSIAKAKKAKASDVTKSIEQQMADARKESVEFREGEWDQMWKNAAKSKPKMSFKQATEFVDEVGLDKKEKTNALKTAKKWLK